MRTLAKISTAVLLVVLVGLSFRRPASRAGSLAILMEPDGAGVWRELFDEFHRKNPDIPVEFVEGPPSTNTREDMYSTAFLAGAGGFDVVYSDVVWVPKFAAAGWLLDLTDRLSTADRQDFLPADLEGGSYQGHLYRIPAFTDAGLLYYRKDLVPRPPSTFEELRAYAKEHQGPDRWGFVWQGKQYEGLVTFFLEVLWGYGGEWIDPATRTVHLDEPEAIRALAYMVELIGDESPPGVTTYIEEDTRNLFQNGHSVFLRNWLYVWRLVDQGGGIRKDQIGFTPMVHEPNRKSAASLGGWGFAISRFTRNPEAAWRLVEFLTRPESLTQVRQRVGRVPARKSQVPAEFLPILLNARPRPPIPEYAQASDILQRWLSAALTRRVSPQEALSEAAKQTRLLLQSE
jgi:multiple sugar transport system substrate-binding protein